MAKRGGGAHATHDIELHDYFAPAIIVCRSSKPARLPMPQ
jgi:hypothetical protein